MRILTVNAGSSSLKLRVLDDADRTIDRADVEHTAGAVDQNRLAESIGKLGPVDAVGHRIVHGGTHFANAVLIDGAVKHRLRELIPLAPLHQAAALEGIVTVEDALAGLPNVACFDTAFHQTLPAAAHTYALPAGLRERFGLRRFGFHGLSHAYAARRAAELLGRPASKLRTVVCHLGAGASLAAVNGGRSVDTTMGFTPLEGLVMASRSGSIDPGLLLWLIENGATSATELRDALEHRSGLVGLAGTADMREVLDRAVAGDDRAALALDVYDHRLRSLIAGMVAAMGGCDAVVFTGGVGEHAPLVRQRAAQGLAFLGVALDDHRNAVATGDADLSTASATVRTLVVSAREDLQIASEVRAVLSNR